MDSESEPKFKIPEPNKEGFQRLWNLLFPDEQVDINSPELVESLNSLLNQLNSREQSILQKRHGLFSEKGLPIPQVASELGTTNERIRRIEGMAFKKLRYLIKKQ